MDPERVHTEPEEVRVKIVVNSKGKIERSGKAHHEVVVHPGWRVVWTCDTADFRISAIHKVRDCCECIDSPFEKFSDARFAAGDSNRSGPVVKGAVGHVYKAVWEVFKKGGERTDRWDPHIYVGP
jgi:hypothetical protein